LLPLSFFFFIALYFNLLISFFFCVY
jgi:hypothetical protein